MKRFTGLVVAVFILSFIAVGMAQANCGKCGKGSAKDADWLQKKMTKMTENLGLSEEQATSIEALMKEKIEKKTAIKKEKLEAIKAVREEYFAKIQEVLTDEQKAKHNEMKAAKDKGSMKGSGHEYKGSGGDMDEKKGSGGDMGEKKGS